MRPRQRRPQPRHQQPAGGGQGVDAIPGQIQPPKVLGGEDVNQRADRDHDEHLEHGVQAKHPAELHQASLRCSSENPATCRDTPMAEPSHQRAAG